MRLCDLLDNENSKLKDDEKDFIKKLYEKQGLYNKHFTFENYPDILNFLNKHNIKILDETEDLTIFEEIIEKNEKYMDDNTTIIRFGNIDLSQNIYLCDLFRDDEYTPTFHLYFKVIYSCYISSYYTKYITYQIKHFSFQ